MIGMKLTAAVTIALGILGGPVTAWADPGTANRSTGGIHMDCVPIGIDIWSDGSVWAVEDCQGLMRREFMGFREIG
ncbi:hypothetical protein [Skermania piniformis]|uniref:Uncharacterized protein n=1 Tax=Skermania pinensis TaxID=39122 RepID=A0ABX8SB72_9ACTN|nr:hypothetical protein [Skermania piniformis]QXQ14571.1 hypothetical protein KV203_03970 [Skermania piniformis]